MDITWKIAIGVCVGILMAAFAYEAIETARARAALVQMQADIEAQRQAQQRADAANQQQRALQAQARASQAAANQRAVESAKLAQIAASQAKEEAWKRYYQPTVACKESWTVDCANGYITAKRAFEAQYKPKP